MSWDSIHRDLQEDVKARLDNADYFSDVTVLLQRQGNIDNEVQRALSVLNEKAGKMGACVIVLMPETEAPEENLPGPPIEIVLSVQVIEVDTFNADTDNGGTGKDAESLANHVLSLLHHYAAYLLGGILVADKKPIRPIKVDNGVSYIVTVRLRTGLNSTNKVRTPELTNEADMITLTCATAGATIHYTLDGSYPGPMNAQAIEYTVPFAEPVAGTRIRYAASKTDLIPSDTAAALIEA